MVPRPPHDTSSPDDLRARVARLEERLTNLANGTFDELLARRLVIVDADDRERVVIATGSDRASVEVRPGRAPPEAGRSTLVELYVVDPLDGDGAEAGVAVSLAGDVVRRLSALAPGSDDFRSSSSSSSP